MEEELNLEQLTKDVTAQIRSGKRLFGKDGAFAPLLESILNAALEGELDAHLTADILIACIDGLTGFPEAIKSVFSETDIQLCIIHQICNSMKYVGSKHRKEFMQDLKLVYLVYKRISRSGRHLSRTVD